MITRIPLDLTDDERRAITGSRRLATRKQIVDFVGRLVAMAIQSDAVKVVDDQIEFTGRVDFSALTCTTLDHLYALGPKTAETTCYCGKRRWFSEPK